ncbi:hypothetical protein [Parasphingorhabdus cellanae]|uniref:Tetratricopeptide repeat protein n=1 Tax=Parasphingorhabdus cellanae TaxID=2806553 RepID=A0ABX7T189_9SPHN|nr:hypothetical protein [Parasphingorhabdus cellanae]QTD55326.1 hypothetical protein J4G78_14060 [Parasphingorhabdus cellanae]
MKNGKFIAIAIGLTMVALPGLAQAQDGEIGYAKGALAYDALMSGDNQSAVDKLESGKLSDPAVMINLGQAYARTGRSGDAAKMFTAAMNSNRSFDLVLANGQVIDSRKAAEIALNNLNGRLASR